MQKLLLTGLAVSMLLISCGGEDDKSKEESKDVLDQKEIKNAELVINNLCDCAEKEDPTDCRNTLPQGRAAVDRMKEEVEIPKDDSEEKQKLENHMTELEDRFETCRKQLLKNEVNHLYGEHIEVLETFMTSIKADLEDVKSSVEEGSADARKKWDALSERMNNSEEFGKALNALESIKGSTTRRKFDAKMDSLQTAIWEARP